MSVERIMVTASKVALDLLRSDELPDAAASALESGYDSPSLRVLAGLNPAQIGEAKAVFARALVELRVEGISKRDAVLYLARETASAILSEVLTPRAGAEYISQLTLQIPDESVAELDSFVYAASEWGDRPEDHDVFEEGILIAAESLLRARQD